MWRGFLLGVCFVVSCPTRRWLTTPKRMLLNTWGCFQKSSFTPTKPGLTALGNKAIFSPWRLNAELSCRFSCSKRETPHIVATSKTTPIEHPGSPRSMRCNKAREIPARDARSVVVIALAFRASRTSWPNNARASKLYCENGRERGLTI